MPRHCYTRQAAHLGQWVVLAVVLLACGTSHAATTVTLQPDSSGTSNGDAFVTTGSATDDLSGNNSGAAGALAVSAALPNGTFASLLRFDLSSATSTFNSTYGTGGWSIDCIALQLTTTTANNPIFNPSQPGTFDVKWISSNAWVEGTGNPNNPSTTGVNWTDFAGLTSGAQAEGVFNVTNVGDGVTASYTLSPSSGLLFALQTGSQASLALTADPTDSAMSALFNARNFGTPGRRPALIITASALAVPEPGRAMLLMLGTLGTLRRRRCTDLPL